MAPASAPVAAERAATPVAKATAETPADIWAAPSLPPLAAAAADEDVRTLDDRPDSPAMAVPPPLAAPVLAGAVVESNDYVVVDEPLVEPAATAHDALALNPPQSLADPEPASNDAPPSAVAESFALRPHDRSVVVRNVPAPAAPPRPAISLDSLVRVRDALVTFVSQAREQQLAAAAAATAAPMRVMVESENDRLAMVPELADPGRDRPAPPAASRVARTPPAAEPALAPAALLHAPTALVRDLRALPAGTSAAQWSAVVLTHLDRLTAAPAPPQRAIQETLADLRTLAVDGLSAALTTQDASTQSAWARAARALDRRLPVWQLLLDEEAAGDLSDLASRTVGDAALLPTLHEVAALTAGTQEGAAWRRYLRLDDLAGLTSVAGSDYSEARRAAARDVLVRMNDARLTPAQREFLTQEPLAALARDLRPWAGGAISLETLAALIERYELAGALGDADAIAELRQRMRWSDDPRLAVLADDVNRNYRNANVRVAIAAEMFNRLIPPQEPTMSPVNEQIAGAEVHGRSRTETQVHMRLIPAATVWQLGLEVQGTVRSQTYSDVGPARVRNASQMEYEARKVIMLDPNGLHVWPSEATVEGRSSLVGIDSRLEPVPIVGTILENTIREKHRENKAAAMKYVKAKVSREARFRMDREADAKLEEFEQRFVAGVFAPLERFSLDYQPVDMSTTEERAVVRLRMAGEQQLAAHTPRPSAPSDSLASVQLHESAVNNAIRGLGLDGRRMTVGDLHALLAEKFTQRTEAPADLPQRAVVEFAAHDAARVSCHDDCIELTIRIVELKKGRDRICNVGVHAFFKPVIDGLEVKLVRDGALQFEGAHLRTGPRLVLHSVFGKLLRKDDEMPLLVKRIDEDPRFAGLMVTQLVIDDGWVALSIGPTLPNRTAWRTRCEAVTR
jgi:hypothetical protein